MAKRATGVAAAIEADRAQYIGNLGDWEEDPELQASPRLGLRLIVDVEPDDAALLNRACEHLDMDYDDFLLRAMRASARAVLEESAQPPLDAITVAEAAQRYSVTRTRLQRAAMEGRLPAEKLGRGRSHRWLVRPEDIERFLRESRHGPKKRAGAA